MNRRYGWRPFALIVLTFLSGPLRGLDLLRADGPDTAGHFSEPAINASDRDYWAYQPVVRPDVPQIESDAWSHNPIDKFVLHQLRRRNSTAGVPLKPAAAAGRGKPPATDHIRSHRTAADACCYHAVSSRIRPLRACEQVVEQLLDDPAYGERWAQHWLDLVRFAETDGFEHDKVRPQAWRYRDWVIEALNNDLPYDQFLTLQLAGDEVAPDSPAALVATGYLMAGAGHARHQPPGRETAQLSERHDGQLRLCLSRSATGLCPMPSSSNRSDLPARLLSPPRLFRDHRPVP